MKREKDILTPGKVVMLMGLFIMMQNYNGASVLQTSLLIGAGFVFLATFFF